jgi:hypothetical protein
MQNAEIQWFSSSRRKPRIEHEFHPEKLKYPTSARKS